MSTTHQRGYVTARGKQWYGYYRKVVNDPASNEEKTLRVPVILGLKSTMSKYEAREALQREITKQMGEPGSPTRVMNDGSVTFAWFVMNRFLPLKEAAWKKRQPKLKRFSFSAISSSLSARFRWSTSTSSACNSTSTSWRQPGQRTEFCKCARIFGTSLRRQSIKTSLQRTQREGEGPRATEGD